MKVFLTTLALIGTLLLLLLWGISAPVKVHAATILFPSGGGTGWGTPGGIQTGAIPYGQGLAPFATTTQGTGGYVLSWQDGIPKWVATSSIQNISLTTTGSSGAATLVGNTLNIPQYSGGGTSAYEIATTSSIAVPDIAYFTQTAGRTTLGSIATGTVSAGTGISVTANRYSLNGNLAITNTAPDQTVVLTAGDGLSISSSYPNFSLFNPYAIATDTSNFAVPNLVYLEKAGGKTTLGSVATTTLSGNSQVAVSNSPVVIGASGAVLSIVADSIGDTQLAFNTGQNLTTASSPTFAGATIGTLNGVIKGSTGVLSAATNGTDYTLITANSCSAGNHVSAITAAGVITCSADTGSGLSSYDAWTHPAAGYSATTSAVGIGTSTAWGFLAVNPTAGIAPRSFVVGSSTGTLFEIENDGRVGIGTSTIGTGLMGQFNVDADSKATAGYFTGSNNGFLEINVQNRSNGASASSDHIATSDNGTATTHYVDFGINGSGGGQTPFATANHAYLYSIDDPLNFGALGATAPFMTWNVGGGSSPIERARMGLAGFGIGTSTPKWTLTVSSSTAPQLTLTDGSLTNAPFNQRANGQYFTLGTSSPTTFATSSQVIFMANGNTGSTSLQRLSVVGAATSTITGGLTIESFAATRAVFSAADKGLVTSAASASLINSLTDETGTGVAVFGTSPTFTTSIAAVPLISGGAAVGSTLAIQGTSAGSPTTASLTLRAASTISPSMTFTTRGIGAGTTTPGYLLNLASSTAPQLALSDGSITAAPWTFRSGNGNFYLATSSTLTYATSSNATLNNPFSIIAGGISGLFGFGSSTPWANVSITNTAGIPGFAIGSTTGTSFMVDLLGRALVGTTTGPTADYSVIASSTIVSYENRVATSSTTDIPFGKSNMTTVRMGSAAMTLTFSELWPGAAQTIKICNPNQSVAGALTWPTGGTLLWDGGTAPTQITTADKCWYVSCRVSVGTSTVAKADCLKAGGTTGF